MIGTLDVDRYLARRFKLAGPRRYHCWDMLREGWLELTGEDLGDRTPVEMTFAALTGRFMSDVPTFVPIEVALSPSIVLMQRLGVVPHVGLFYEGRVLQITTRGGSYQPPDIATAGFSDVGFYLSAARYREIFGEGLLRHQSA